MKDRTVRQVLKFATLLSLVLCATVPMLAAIKNWAMVVAPGSKLQDVSLADLTKMCKGMQKAWPDGKGFTLVIHNPDAPELRTALVKLFGVSEADLKPAISKLNENHPTLKVVETDEELLRTVASTPGAVDFWTCIRSIAL